MTQAPELPLWWMPYKWMLGKAFVCHSDPLSKDAFFHIQIQSIRSICPALSQLAATRRKFKNLLLSVPANKEAARMRKRRLLHGLRLAWNYQFADMHFFGLSFIQLWTFITTLAWLHTHCRNHHARFEQRTICIGGLFAHGFFPFWDFEIFFWFLIPSLPCFSAFPCFFDVPLFCFSAFPYLRAAFLPFCVFLLFCFSGLLLLCFFDVPLVCFSASLPLYFSPFLLSPAFLLFQLLCFSAFCFSLLT